jgi:protein involved in polysaccharide export with SLBB domain
MTRHQSHVTFTSAGLKAVLLLAGLLAFAPVASVAAQNSIGEMRRQATRSELEKAAKVAESAALSAPDEKTRARLRADAAAVRMRLENGDFIPGDRILLLVEGDTALTDTFTVRGDRMLPLPNIPPISLQGVLDSELEAHLTTELLRYIKTVSLQATPLIRISLLGFPQSSFYTVPVDQAITDVITAAGGWGSPSAVATEKAVVRRNGAVFMDAQATAIAIREGKTVGDMALRDGDELYVPARSPSTFTWQTVVGVIGTATSLYWLFRYGQRGR